MRDKTPSPRSFNNTIFFIFVFLKHKKMKKIIRVLKKGMERIKANPERSEYWHLEGTGNKVYETREEHEQILREVARETEAEGRMS